jgi:hypothetical protein
MHNHCSCILIVLCQASGMRTVSIVYGCCRIDAIAPLGLHARVAFRQPHCMDFTDTFTAHDSMLHESWTAVTCRSKRSSFCLRTVPRTV